MGHASLSGSSGSLTGLVVTSYSTGLNTNLTSTQLKMGTVVTSRRVSQGQFTFTVKTRSVTEQRQVINFVRKHQVDAITKDGTEVRFLYPSQNLDYLGFVRRVQYNHALGDHAPSVSIDMILVRDLVNTKTSSSSYGGDFNDFYSTEIDFDEILSPPIGEADIGAGLKGAAENVNDLSNMKGSAQTGMRANGTFKR